MKKSITLIIIVAIIAGIIVIFSAGFNLDISTKSHQQIQINIGKVFESKDIKQIASEVLEGQVEVKRTGDFDDQTIILAKEISEEQISQIVTKINENYGTELNASSISVVSIPATKLMDLLTPYIWSVVISTVLILLYLVIRYKKQGVLKVIAKLLICIVILELLVLSIVALLRIPTGQNLASIIFVTYAIAVLLVTTMLENSAQKIKLEEINSKK